MMQIAALLLHSPLSASPAVEKARIVTKVGKLMALVEQFETQLADSRATAETLMEAVVAELTSRLRYERRRSN